MSRPHFKKLDLDIEVDVLTAGALAEIVNSILEFLLFQRNQIEFVYRTFRGFVNDWNSEACEVTASDTINGYMIQRQREKALQTKDSISAMRNLINNAFEQHVIKSIRFLFGSTSFTPKEAYTIHVPIEELSLSHLYDHHKLPAMRLNQLLLTLLTKEDLYGVFSKDLSQTNLFLELEILERDCKTPSSSSKSSLYPKQITNLPLSCKDIHFHLRHKVPADFDKTVLNCCKELVVFEELLHMEKSLNVEKCVNGFSIDDLITNWWEADVVVRGFKERLIKGKSIWK